MPTTLTASQDLLKNKSNRTFDNLENKTIISEYKCPLCEKTTNCRIGFSLHLRRAHNLKKEEKSPYLSKYIKCYTQFELDFNKRISEAVRKEIYPGMTKTKLGILKAKERLSNIILEDGTNAYKKMIKERTTQTAKTQRITGHYDKLSKLLKERQLKVHEDGLNEAQRRANLTIQTKRNTIDPKTGLSVLESSIKKGIETMRNTLDENGIPIIQKRAINGMKSVSMKNKLNIIKSTFGWEVPKGSNEKKILDEIERKEGIKILRECCIAGSYFPDGYCEESNTIYEVYELFHYKSKEKIEQDKIREERIKKILNCNFVIINDTTH